MILSMFWVMLVEAAKDLAMFCGSPNASNLLPPVIFICLQAAVSLERLALSTLSSILQMLLHAMCFVHSSGMARHILHTPAHL